MTSQYPPACFRRRRRHRSSGQSLVEFSLAFPMFLLLCALAFTGSQAMGSVIGLSGAARAGAIAAANDVSVNTNVPNATELADAVAAVNYEEGCSGCYSGVANQGTCPASSSCVWIVRTTGSRSATPIEVVHVMHPIVPFIPLLSKITVQAQAGATP